MNSNEEVCVHKAARSGIVHCLQEFSPCDWPAREMKVQFFRGARARHHGSSFARWRFALGIISSRLGFLTSLRQLGLDDATVVGSVRRLEPSADDCPTDGGTLAHDLKQHSLETTRRSLATSPQDLIPAESREPRARRRRVTSAVHHRLTTATANCLRTCASRSTPWLRSGRTSS